MIERKLEDIIKNKLNKGKAIVLLGARQVGKTFLLKRFGLDYFESVAYFNFDQQNELKQFFETTKDPKRILQNLTLVHGKPILPHKTLIIFDEIHLQSEPAGDSR